MPNTTPFRFEQIRDVLGARPIEHQGAVAPAPANYDEFRSAFPVETAEMLKERVLAALRNGEAPKATLYTTSGTSGPPKLLLNSIWRRRPEEGPGYGRSIVRALKSSILAPSDVVANLFAAGGFSSLFEGSNRTLEMAGVTVLPVGRLDSYGSETGNYLQLMKLARCNVLLGTPTSISQAAMLAARHDIELRIEKVIFTGEMFSDEKKSLIRYQWPETKIFGLYGQNETAFLGFNTPECEENHYHVFDDWFFIEAEEDHFLITTGLNAAMPLVRYRIDDRIKIVDAPCSCGREGLTVHVLGRGDQRFKYAGNIISTDLLTNKISRIFGKPVFCQYQLTTTVMGSDQLCIAIEVGDSDFRNFQAQVQREIESIEDIQEGFAENMGVLRILPWSDHWISERQKIAILVDRRILK